MFYISYTMRLLVKSNWMQLGCGAQVVSEQMYELYFCPTRLGCQAPSAPILLYKVCDVVPCDHNHQ